MPGASKAGEGQHGYARLDIEAASFLGDAESNLRQVFGARFDIDGCVRQEIQVALAGDDEVDARHFVNSLAHPNHLQGRTDGVGICLLYTSDAADEEASVDLGGRR